MIMLGGMIRGPLIVEKDRAVATEAARLEVVRRHARPRPALVAFIDHITALAARIFDVPVAFVSIVDEKRIWFKSVFGLKGPREIPRAPGLFAGLQFLCRGTARHRRRTPFGIAVRHRPQEPDFFAA